MPIERTPRSSVETLWQRFAAHDWDGARDVLHPDFTCYWPQSAERFVGRDNFLAMNQAHPAPNWRIARLTVLGDDVPGVEGLAAAHVLVPADDGLDICTGFYRAGPDGRMLEAWEYWTTPTATPTPQWRAQWTDRMPPDRWSVRHDPLCCAGCDPPSSSSPAVSPRSSIWRRHTTRAAWRTRS